jgi:transglutaminase-like putative cysteine protease
MQIRVGCSLEYEMAQRTPMMVMLNVHHSRTNDLVSPDYVKVEPAVPITDYHDSFGNWCTRLVAPPGRVQLSTSALVRDAGRSDPCVAAARQEPVEDLPHGCLMFLLGSRYCETDRLSASAWRLFGETTPGWPRVQAICDYVNAHITFGYEHASASKTAWDAFVQGKGVCRDFAHLAIAFCRAMNIPARYCTGYLSDIGEAPPFAAMDFAGWMEVWLDGAWHTFDPRNNTPRKGRVLIGRGRDAADVALSNTFGPNTLLGFNVWAEEVATDALDCTAHYEAKALCRKPLMNTGLIQ